MAKRRRHRASPPETLRTSERNSLNRCRQRWHWGYNDRLSPIREAPALRFGTLVHGALEHYYSRKNQARRKPIHPAVTFKRLFQEELTETEKEWNKWRDEDDEWHDYLELGMVMMEGYVNQWRGNDKEYIVLAVEQRFRTAIVVPAGEPALESPSPTIYVGTLDRILYHIPTRRLLFGDYKTTKNDPTKNSHLVLDEQAGSYLAMGVPWLMNGAPKSLWKDIRDLTAHLPRAHRKKIEALQFDGILYDFMKKALPDDRPVNEAGYAVNKPQKADLVEKCKAEGLPYKGLKVDELVEVIDETFGENWAYKHLGEISKTQPGPLFHREPVFRDYESSGLVLERIYQDAVEIGKLRQGELAIKKSPDRFICIGCPFIDMCELHESGADWTAFRDAMFEEWDPYSTYWIDYDELT